MVGFRVDNWVVGIEVVGVEVVGIVGGLGV